MDINPASTANTLSSVAASSDLIDVPYGASLTADAEAFESSMAIASERARTTEGMSEIAKAALEPLESLNEEAMALGKYAESAVASGNTLTPGEIVSLTVQSQKFMFHSQLTANVANRTADGIQQLFRQQG